MLRCPDPSCLAAVGHDMVDKLASEEDKDKYNRYFLRSYIEDNRKVNATQIAYFRYVSHPPDYFISLSG